MRNSRDPVIRGPHSIVRFTSRSSTRFTVSEKGPLMLPAREESNHFKHTRHPVLKACPGEKLTGARPAGDHQSPLTAEGKYPTAAPPSIGPAKGGGENRDTHGEHSAGRRLTTD